MIRILLLALLLVSCGGGGGSDDPVSTPADPTTGNPTPPPPPPAPEPEPVVVDVSDSPGAYFKSVVITVTGDWDGSYEASIGNVTETDTGLEIRSDGRTGTGSLTIDGEEHFYEIEQDQKCLNGPLVNNKYKIDCEGHMVGGASAPMIWYGEEDTQIVDIEVGLVRNINGCNIGFYNDECVVGESIPEDNELRIRANEFIEWANEFNLRSGVWIRFVMTDYVWGQTWQDVLSFGGDRRVNEMSDVVLGVGPSGGAHGQALQARSVYEGMLPPKPVSLSLGGTALHEIGHAMSLGHGIWGNPDWTYETSDFDTLIYSTGAIFPRFGHGWSGKIGEGACGAQGTVMSYSSKALWSNSTLSCEALGYPAGAWGDAAGNRQQSDEAYALNRIRYSFSLIHNEHKK